MKQNHLCVTRGALLALSTSALLFAGCASTEPPPNVARKETLYGVTAKMALIKFNAAQPQRIIGHQPLVGLPESERLVGLDFRVARGVLFALSNVGRVYTIDTSTATLKPVSAAQLMVPLGDAVGMDFNPAVDRIRIVTQSGQNLRMHPDTGAQVDSNPSQPGVQSDAAPHYLEGDVNRGRTPAIAAVAYTYNKDNDKITTLYGIDQNLGVLVMQGSKEGDKPFVSPDTGKLSTVGALGTGAVMDASFDISDVSNTALLAARTASDQRTRLHLLDLRTGQASLLGTVGDGQPLIGIAIEP